MSEHYYSISIIFCSVQRINGKTSYGNRDAGHEAIFALVESPDRALSQSSGGRLLQYRVQLVGLDVANNLHRLPRHSLHAGYRLADGES